MATTAQVRAFLNAVARKKYSLNYRDLSDNQASVVRKSAVRKAFRK